MLRFHLYRTLTLLVFCGVYHSSATNCVAHPFHTSLTEMDWNPETSRWEVGMRVYANDLEIAVQKLVPEFKLDSHWMKDSAAELSIQRYIEQNFYADDFHLNKAGKGNPLDRSPEPSDGQSNNDLLDKKVSKLHWVGTELEGCWIWLYFEHVVPPSDQVRIVNRILFDVNSDQINVISIRQGRKRFSTQTHEQLDHFEFKSAPNEMRQ